MKTFAHLEDYIEFMAGITDPVPGSITAMFGAASIQTSGTVFKLARYDKGPVENMSSQTYFGTAFTDRQAALAQRIVLNYRKQFAKQGIDVSPMEDNPAYRLPLRTIDRRKLIYIEDNKIVLKFPYDKKLIDELRDFRVKHAVGNVSYYSNKDKAWMLALTEQHVAWSAGWGKINGFDVSDELIEMDKQVREVEAIDYKIELIEGENEYEITNAAESLKEYVNEKLGGFGKDNLLALIREAGMLSYTISDTIREQLPATIRDYVGQRVIHLHPGKHSIKDIIEFAKVTDRFPIYIFDPHNSYEIEEQLSNEDFAEDEVVKFDLYGKTKTCDYELGHVKIMYARKIPKTWNYKTPLFISTTNLPHSHVHMRCLVDTEMLIEYFNQKL